jgi:tryptophan synthase alpha chain
VTLPAGARHVRAAFDAAHADGRAALVIYLMAGHPDEATALDAADGALGAGADLLEIGVPFSDPVADGPVIAAAGHAAVASGAGLDTVVRTVRALRERGRRQPILAMGYLNPVVADGAADALRKLATAGVDALIVPDLPAGEDPQLERLIADAGLGIAFLVAPNTPPERVERAIRASTAFVYVVPLLGVTGARDRVASSAGPLLQRVRSLAAGRLPVGVGFGVSTPEHVRELAPHADGIIVGSSIVATLNDGGPKRVGTLVASLARATGAATVSRSR